MTLCVCQTDTMVVLTHSAQQQIKGTEIDSGTLEKVKSCNTCSPNLAGSHRRGGRIMTRSWCSHICWMRTWKSGNTQAWQADHGADNSCMHDLGEAGGSIQ